MLFTMEHLVTADHDVGCMRVHHAGGGEVVQQRAFLDAHWLPSGATCLVVEAAHLAPRNRFSVAQLYTQEQLEAFHGLLAERGVEVRLANGRLRPKIAAFTGLDKDEDARSWYEYLVAHPAMLDALKRWDPRATEREAAGWEHRDATRLDISRTYNVWRAHWNEITGVKKFEIPEVAACREIVTGFREELDERATAYYDVKVARNGDVRFNVVPMMSLYACYYDLDGRKRLRPDGQPLGVRYLVDDVIGLHGHSIGNLMRSQFTHHGFRNYANARAKEDGIDRQALKAADTTLKLAHPDAFREYRGDYTRMVKRMLRYFRDA